MVDHGDHDDLAVIVADDHLRAVAYRKDLVLLQRAVEHVDALDNLALKLPVQDAQGAALFTAAHKAGVDDLALVGFQHLGHALLRLAVNLLVAGRQKEEDCDEDQADQHRRVILYSFFGQKLFHNNSFHTAKKRTANPSAFCALENSWE